MEDAKKFENYKRDNKEKKAKEILIVRR